MESLKPARIALDGFNLVEASAGTGKTHAITSLYLRILMEKGLPVRNILVVTYTRAATEELRLKIRERMRNALSIIKKAGDAQDDDFVTELVTRLRDEGLATDQELVFRLEEALLCLDEAAVFTIHSFCQRMLREFAFESSSPLQAEILPSEKEILQEGCAEFVRRYFYTADRLLLEWMDQLFGLNDLPGQIYKAVGPVVRLPLPEIIHPCSLEEVLEEAKLLRKRQKQLAEAGEQNLVALKRDIKEIVLGAIGELKEHLKGAFSKGPEAAEEITKELEKGLKRELNRLLKEGITAVEGLSDSGRPIAPGALNLGIFDPACLGSWEFLPLLLERLLPGPKSKKSRKLQELIGSHRPALERAVAGWIEDMKRQGPPGGMERVLENPAMEPLFWITRVHRGINDRMRSAVLCQARDFIRDFARARRKLLSVMTYDDMLIMLKDALCSGAGGEILARKVAARFPVALIDEFQDTDSVQWQIFRAIYSSASGSGLFLIGDPKQAIYGFRGADIFTYLKARDMVPERRRYSLEVNWRSSPALVDAVDHIFRKGCGDGNTFVLKGIEFNKVYPRKGFDETLVLEGEEGGRAAEIWLFEDRQEGGPGADTPLDAAHLTALEIRRILSLGREGRAFFTSGSSGKRPVTAGDIAVLVRNFMEAASVREALYGLGIPSVYQGPGSVFNTYEAREVLYMLNAVANPSDTTAICTALGTVSLGYPASRIYRLCQDPEAWEQVAESFSDFRTVWARKGVYPMLRSLFHRFGVPANLLAMPDGERRLTNLRQIAEMLAQAEKDHSGMEHLILWLSDNIRDPDDQADEQRLRLETDENLVKVMSYHRSKGLEFPILFLPFIDQVGLKERRETVPRFYSTKHECYICPVAEKIPQTRPGQGPDWESGRQGGSEHSGRLPAGWMEEIERQQEAERVRLVYVALTRARHKLFMCFSSLSSLYSSTLGRILTGRTDEPASKEEQARKALERRFSGSCGVKIFYHHEKMATASRQGTEGRRAEQDRAPALCPPLKVKRRPVAPRVWMQTSFSSLTRQDEGRPGLEAASARPGMETGESAAPDIFSFPRGPVAGNCVHRLFETIDFRGSAEEFIVPARKALEEFRMEDRWDRVLADMAAWVVSTDLGNGLRLSALEPSWISREMEFIRPFTSQEAGHFPEREYHLEKGVIKGFMDLVFRWQEAFYILDYKTNWLGDRVEDYGRDSLDRAMDEHDYWLQAGIYAAALDRYLSAGIEGYNMDRHMGGIFYLFVRGMRPEHGSDYGVRFISPREIRKRFPGFFKA